MAVTAESHKGIATYNTKAANEAEALQHAKVWLEMYADRESLVSGEDYDLDAATVTTFKRYGSRLFEVRIPVHFTSQSNPMFMHRIDGIPEPA